MKRPIAIASGISMVAFMFIACADNGEIQGQKPTTYSNRPAAKGESSSDSDAVAVNKKYTNQNGSGVTTNAPPAAGNPNLNAPGTAAANPPAGPAVAAAPAAQPATPPAPSPQAVCEAGAKIWMADDSTCVTPVNIFRCYNPANGDHMMTLDQGECGRAGHTLEGVAFRVAQEAGNGRALISRWFAAAKGYHYVLGPGEGAGLVHEGPYGYIFSSPRPGTRAIYRCWVPTLNLHMTTTSNICEGAPMANAGVVGYAY